MFKLRNAIEAGIVAILIGIPVLGLALSLTTRIIILCLTALPLSLLALIGISGESFTSFALIFFRYVKKRRVIEVREDTGKTKKRKPPKEKKSGKQSISKRDFPAEFDEIKKRPAKEKPIIKSISEKAATLRASDVEKPLFLNPVAEYLPIEKIEHGVIYTKDHRYVKIVEVEPINFLLRSEREQQNIIYSFISFLKISPTKVQFKVLTKHSDINRHLEQVEADMAREINEQCKVLQQDYGQLIRKIGSKEAVTRRFFMIFEAELRAGTKRGNEEIEAISYLHTAARTAANYLRQCGNEVRFLDHEDEFSADALYSLLNRKSSIETPLSKRVHEVTAQYMMAEQDFQIGKIPICEYIAPASIDFSHGRYMKIDDVYYSYLLIPSDGFRSNVNAGWLSLIVNAGEGIDLDFFLSRQPKERIITKLGQQLRINRSKVKDTNDTNTDFDDLNDAIRSGYFLKEGLANNEDFYYINLLITITAGSVEELEWRQNEMRKMLISADLSTATCSFQMEQAFLSSLPLVSMDSHLYARSKRNVLTLGAASCYPFTSFEMCDDNGILLGVNKHNNSLVILDIFDSKSYKNANIALLGTSGAGKSYLLQLMAMRMRRKGIKVFIVAPLKGHEMHRACTSIGGEFIQISPASRNCINVFELRQVDNYANEMLDGTAVDKSALAAKIQRLHIFFSLLVPDMTHEEKQLLDEALIQTYALRGITHDNRSLVDPANPGRYRKMPIIGDLYDILIQKPETKRLSNIINRLVNGSASSFNQQTNVNLENDYTVLDISELTGDLLTVGMFVALDYVWDKAKENRTEEKAIFIDEAWHLLGASSSRLAAEFCLEIAKIIRGYGGSAVFATQDINDFFALDDGKYGKGIINNSKTEIILNLEDDEAEHVRSILCLSEAEVMEITHFEQGNGLISTNNNNISVQFKSSPMEHDLITTDRQDLKKLLQQKEAETK